MSEQLIIIDYPDLISTKAVTEEGQKRLNEAIKMMNKFHKEHPVTLVNADGIAILK